VGALICFSLKSIAWNMLALQLIYFLTFSLKKKKKKGFSDYFFQISYFVSY